ncbi:hypothetical protein SAMN05444285_13316 [Draconibacterium orientale]|jgi:hypothetical protein|uniref:Uncharacterized protein n=1 Tax=Draconibacterium orientale TaxID=1168034 RepID=A0A1I0ILV3_9BACT|nr:hypothetical protein SAMN05444285_13316 [Draconibacterium orientale]
MFYKNGTEPTTYQHLNIYTRINIHLIFFLLILLVLIFLNGIIPYYLLNGLK